MMKFATNRSLVKWLVVPAIVLLALAAAVFYFIRSQDIQINEDLYQYVSGIRFDYHGKTTITKNDAGVQLANNKNTVEMDSTPLYCANKDRVFLPVAMLYMNGAQKQLARLDYFTEIYIGGGLVKAQRGKTNLPLDGGFAFDGQDTYLFLEPVTLLIEGEMTEVPPLSYAVVTYNRQIELYLYGKDRYLSAPIDAAGMIATTRSGYRINLNSDIFIHADGVEQLLFNKPELLPPLA